MTSSNSTKKDPLTTPVKLSRNARIYIAGHTGMVGSAVVRFLQDQGYSNVITRSRSELDLTTQQAVNDFFNAEGIDAVILSAARVGGIYANSHYPAEFIYENLMIQNNVIHAAFCAGVQRLLFLGSSCIYPRLASQPLREEYLLSGYLEPTNEPYALAKIAGIKMCESYNRQYGTQYLAVMPTNLYGPGDNYHPENSHVIPALIRRFHEAQQANASTITVWGTGTPRREFLYSEDMADACVYLMNLVDAEFIPLLGQDRNDGLPPLVNIGCGEDLTIRELAELVKEVVGFAGALTFDTSKPDGTMRKLMDVSRINALGWQRKTGLKEGIALAYQDMQRRLGSPGETANFEVGRE